MKTSLSSYLASWDWRRLTTTSDMTSFSCWLCSSTDLSSWSVFKVMVTLDCICITQIHFLCTYLYNCVICVSVQRYGLWDNEESLADENPLSESCKRTNQGDENGTRKECEGDDEVTISPTSTLGHLEINELVQLEEVGPST